MLSELSAFLSLLRDIAPLVHCITNRVTMNDCANILLAAGARPIMADDPDECAEITAISRGLCLNIGTLDKAKIPGMLASGRAANRLGLPILLDPVGVGASRLRTRDRAQNNIRAVAFGDTHEPERANVARGEP